MQRWDDHRYYHHSGINQSLHLVSAISFVVAYLMLFKEPAMAALIAWLVSMLSRQAGHFFFEPKGFTTTLCSFSGDTWSINPLALKRIERLFCKNERAVVECRLADEARIALVPVAAILVASIRLHCLPHPVPLRQLGANVMDFDTTVHNGDELGWFEHGSTVILFGPPDARWVRGIAVGAISLESAVCHPTVTHASYSGVIPTFDSNHGFASRRNAPTHGARLARQLRRRAGA